MISHDIAIKRTKIGSFPIESPWNHDRLDVESLLQHASAMTGTKAPVTTPPFTNRPPRPAGQGPSPGRAVQVSRGGVYRGGPVWSQSEKWEDLQTLGNPGGKLWVELEGTWICLRPENRPSDAHTHTRTHTWCYAEVEYSTRIDHSRGQLTKTVYPVQRGNPMVVAHTGTIDACWESFKQWFPALCQVAMRWSCATPKHGNGDT